MANCAYSKTLKQIMKHLCAMTLLVVFSFSHSPVSADEKVIAITNAFIIDGNGGSPIANGTIVVEKGEIRSVGNKITIPDGARIIDAAGQTALPGLADMHVHLTSGGEGEDILGYQRRLNALLYSGVTTVLDTGAVLPFVQQMRQAIEAGKIPGPYIYYVGPLIDSVDPAWPAISRSMASEAQALGIAKYLKDNGADAIKAYAKLSRPQVRALVVAGQAQGLPVIVDAWVRNGMEHYNTVGLRAFAHTPGQVTEETLKVMKERDVFIITTRAVGGIVKHARLRGPSFLQNELIINTTPSWRLDKARNEAARALSDEAHADKNFDEQLHRLLQKNVKSIFDAGIPLVAGTDDGLSFGEDLHFELELLVDAGLTPLEAITAATQNAAKVMRHEDTWGTLEPGKRADILLVSGRPDKNISDTRNIKLVMQKGKVIDRERLIFDEKTDSGIRDTKFGY